MVMICRIEKQLTNRSLCCCCCLRLQERRFDQETTQLLRGYDAELDTLTRSQKQQVERAEQQQETDLRISSKKIRAEQVRSRPTGTTGTPSRTRSNPSQCLGNRIELNLFSPPKPYDKSSTRHLNRFGV